MYKKILFIVLLFLLTTNVNFSQQKSLYQRLGGYDAIAAVTDDFIGRLVQDESISVMFKGHSESSLKRTRQLVVEFICSAAGGPCEYTGRDMKTAHKGLGITEEMWNKTAGYLKDSLNKFKVGQKEQDDLFAAVASIKNDIVEKGHM